ncbi:MAG: DUF6152 family protein, partial [Gammaproteobacteria bacterium]
MSLLKPAVITASMLYSLTAAGHHSPFLFFDPETTVEAEGEVIEVQWRNPHVIFTIESSSGDGAVWHIEANSVSILRRMNLTRDAVSPGDHVSVAGWPAQRGGNEMFVTNMLMQDGQEIVFMPGLPPRWSENVAGDASAWLVTEDDLEGSSGEEATIFRVWSTSLGLGPAEVMLFERYDFPLTAAATTARAGYDIYSNPILAAGCVHKGMPTIMEQPYPMELVQDGDTILLRMEEGDAVREIDMTPGATAAGREPTLMGHSVGRWEGDTLVVTTTGSSWPYVDMTGVPNSASAEIVERLTPTADGKRLDYTMTMTNPAVFTEPTTFSKYWFWVPGETVAPYECEQTAGTPAAAATNHVGRPAFADLADDWNTIRPGEDTMCLYGTEYGFFARPADPSKVLISFPGGGACWSGLTCTDEPVGRMDDNPKTVRAEDNPAGSTGIMAEDNSENPFQDFTKVLVGYCTGDMHIGDAVRPNNGPLENGETRISDTLHFNGYRNAMTVLDWVFDNFESPETVVISGHTSGSYGTPFYASVVADHYPDATVRHLGDGNGALFIGELLQPIREAWGTVDLLNEHTGFAGLDPDNFSFEDITIAAARRHPEIVFTQMITAHDMVFSEMLEYLGVDGPILDVVEAGHEHVKSQVD